MIYGIENVSRVEELTDFSYDVYVVIDVLYFSTTVIELFNQGVTSVTVAKDDAESRALKQADSTYAIGGESKDGGTQPKDGHDFINSPTEVSEIGLYGRPASMSSDNGGRTVHYIRKHAPSDVEIIIASTVNAEAVGDYLKQYDIDDICLVQCGGDGYPAPEDFLGAVVIAAERQDTEIGSPYSDNYKSTLENAVGHFEDKDAHRQRDIRQVKQISSRDIVPISTDQTFRPK